MASEERLRAELDAELDELNDWHNKHTSLTDPWDYEIGSHADGIAIDISKDGSAVRKVIGTVGEAAMRAGYVIAGTLYHSEDSHLSDHTRVFLHEAEEHFEVCADHEAELDSAFDRGAAAGMMFAMMAMGAEEDEEDEEGEEDGAVPQRDAQKRLNPQFTNRVVRAGDDLYVAQESEMLEHIDVPTGWRISDRDTVLNESVYFERDVDDTDRDEAIEHLNPQFPNSSVIPSGERLFVSTHERPRPPQDPHPDDVDLPRGWIVDEYERGHGIYFDTL